MIKGKILCWGYSSGGIVLVLHARIPVFGPQHQIHKHGIMTVMLVAQVVKQEDQDHP